MTLLRDVINTERIELSGRRRPLALSNHCPINTCPGERGRHQGRRQKRGEKAQSRARGAMLSTGRSIPTSLLPTHRPRDRCFCTHHCVPTGFGMVSGVGKRRACVHRSHSLKSRGFSPKSTALLHGPPTGVEHGKAPWCPPAPAAVFQVSEPCLLAESWNLQLQP